MDENDSEKTITPIRYISAKLSSLLSDDEMDSNLIWCIKENVLIDIIEDSGVWPELHFTAGGKETILYKYYESKSSPPLIYPLEDWKFVYFSSLTEYIAEP